MTNVSNIMDLAQQEDPRVLEAQASQEGRLVLAELRSKKINMYTQPDDALRVHREEIAHLLTEEKYNAFLPVMISSNFSGGFVWAPESKVYLTRKLGERYYAPTPFLLDSKQYSAYGHSVFMEELEDQINRGVKFSNLSYKEDTEKQRLTNFLPRRMVEYNPLFVQFCVAIILTDGEDVVMLKTADTESARLRNKYTFIQGHVEVEEDINDMSALDYLRREAIREVNEEVEGVDAGNAEMTFLGLFHDTREKVSQEHISAIFHMKVSSLEMVKTNEADKHGVEVMPAQSLHYLGETDNIVDALYPKLK